MIRIRYQSGSVFLRGKHVKCWVGRYMEDEIQLDGSIHRVHRAKVLGTITELPTEKHARRELARILIDLDTRSQAPKSKILFSEFAKKWEATIVINYKPSTQKTLKSYLRRLNRGFGQLNLSDLTPEKVQTWISSRASAPKTVRNLVATGSSMWKSAKAWGYTLSSPFDGVILPRPKLVERPMLNAEQAREIIRAADEPFKSIFWLVSETGIRGGEACGLFIDDIDFARNLIHVKRSAWNGALQTPKTGNAVRTFAISPQLAEHLKEFIDGFHGAQRYSGGDTRCKHENRQNYRITNRDDEATTAIESSAPEIWRRSRIINTNLYSRPLALSFQEVRGADNKNARLLFQTPEGSIFNNYEIVAKIFKPLCQKFGWDCKGMGLHALRHGNVSAMDSLGVPDAVRLARIGHANKATNMSYTHAIGQDHKLTAEALGDMFDPNR